MKTLNTILNFHRPLKAPQAPPLIFFKFTEGGCHRLDLLVTKKRGASRARRGPFLSRGAHEEGAAEIRCSKDLAYFKNSGLIEIWGSQSGGRQQCRGRALWLCAEAS